MGCFNIFLSPHASTHIFYEGLVLCNSEIFLSVPLSPKGMEKFQEFSLYSPAQLFFMSETVGACKAQPAQTSFLPHAHHVVAGWEGVIEEEYSKCSIYVHKG